jgi:hypothetical protein
MFNIPSSIEIFLIHSILYGSARDGGVKENTKERKKKKRKVIVVKIFV